MSTHAILQTEVEWMSVCYFLVCGNAAMFTLDPVLFELEAAPDELDWCRSFMCTDVEAT